MLCAVFGQELHTLAQRRLNIPARGPVSSPGATPSRVSRKRERGRRVSGTEKVC